MAADRYVLLGLAQVRSAWFRDLSRAATSAALPIEFLKAMSLEEVRVRLRSGRGYSALLVDDSVVGLDRDLVDLALEAGSAVIVVDGGRRGVDWAALGASGVLPTGFSSAELLQLLGQVATPIARTDPTAGPDLVPPEPGGYRARLVAVTGPGGAGRSTVAMALAQGLAADPRVTGMVCLADLARHAEHAMLHGAPDVAPGVVELVDAHRGGSPSVDAIRSLTWSVEVRGYDLLLGLRRHRDWVLIRPRALDAALDGLRRGYRVVVADIDDDFEGERTTGSIDVEERNGMARTVASAADLVVLVGSPTMKGLHGLLRVTRDALEHGVPGHLVLPVVNRAPRSPRARAELTRAFGELLEASVGHNGVPSPVFVAERRNLDALLRDGARLPEAWLGPVCGPVRSLLDAMSVQPTPRAAVVPVAVIPGTIGSWTEQHATPGEGTA